MLMGSGDIFGLVSLVVTVLTSSVSFVSPYWIESLKDADHIYVLDRFFLGLLAECGEKYCDWFLENDFIAFEYLPGTSRTYKLCIAHQVLLPDLSKNLSG